MRERYVFKRYTEKLKETEEESKVRDIAFLQESVKNGTTSQVINLKGMIPKPHLAQLKSKSEPSESLNMFRSTIECIRVITLQLKRLLDNKTNICFKLLVLQRYQSHQTNR